MRSILNWILFGLLSLSLGCAQLGVPKPETFNQKVAVTLSTITELRNQTGILLKAGKIQVDDAQNVQEQLNNARSAVDAARGLRATQPVAAETRLSSTIQALSLLQSYLATRR